MGEDKDRVVSPPRDELTHLRTPLTSSELDVFRLFDKLLPIEWEIYVKPHMNGCRPDFVLLNPAIGIAIFEVRDWAVSVENQSEVEDGQAPILAVTDANGTTIDLFKKNPVDRIHRIRQDIYDLYCPRLRAHSGVYAITAGLVFPRAKQSDVAQLLWPWYTRRKMHVTPDWHPISGMDEIAAESIEDIFPASQHWASPEMTPALAKDLRSWLVEPDFAATQRQPLELDAGQRRLATTRTPGGFRRVKGPAGSGKSLVLAARAAQLAGEGKDVLVITYNITLWHYLRDLAARWPNRPPQWPGTITWLNFHLWCKQVCRDAGREEQYYQLWSGHGSESDGREGASNSNHVLATALPQLTIEALKQDDEGNVPRYDAVVVDEGQDMRLLWWQALRGALRAGGEMMLVADKSQDVYGTARSWTDEAMEGAGFAGGPWAQTAQSYRLPAALAEAAREFAGLYLPKDLADAPGDPSGKQKLGPCRMQWLQTTEEEAVEACVEAILTLSPLADPGVLVIPDITFLAPSQQFGLDVIAQLNKRRIKTVHTFSLDDSESRRMKLAFFMGEARVKATTLHSFKGWETRALVLYTGHHYSEKSLALTYAGMTRVKSHVSQSFITVVCAMPELQRFGGRFNELSDLPVT